jgi:hypothetical protein
MPLEGLADVGGQAVMRLEHEPARRNGVAQVRDGIPAAISCSHWRPVRRSPVPVWLLIRAMQPCGVSRDALGVWRSDACAPIEGSMQQRRMAVMRCRTLAQQPCSTQWRCARSSAASGSPTCVSLRSPPA